MTALSRWQNTQQIVKLTLQRSEPIPARRRYISQVGMQPPVDPSTLSPEDQALICSLPTLYDNATLSEVQTLLTRTGFEFISEASKGVRQNCRVGFQQTSNQPNKQTNKIIIRRHTRAQTSLKKKFFLFFFAMHVLFFLYMQVYVVKAIEGAANIQVLRAKSAQLTPNVRLVDVIPLQVNHATTDSPQMTLDN